MLALYTFAAIRLVCHQAGMLDGSVGFTVGAMWAHYPRGHLIGFHYSGAYQPCHVLQHLNCLLHSVLHCMAVLFQFYCLKSCYVWD